MRRILLSVLIFSLLNIKGFSQCLGTVQNPTGTYVSPDLSQNTYIGGQFGCCYTGQFFVITLQYGLLVFNSSIATDYFTVTDLSNNLITVVAAGSSRAFTNPATYRVHIFANSACATNSACRNVYIRNIANMFPPVVYTGPVTNITKTSASVSGSLIDVGTGTMLERGVCWGHAPNPTINDNVASTTANISSWTANLTSLYPGSLYHARAYGKNTGAGAGYGSDVTFTTSGSPYPGCFGTNRWPLAKQTGPLTNGETKVITTAGNDCNYSGEYFDIDFLPGSYTLKSTKSTDYFSLTTTEGFKIDQGIQPFTINIPGTNGGTYRVNINSSSGCSADQVCRGVSITKNNSQATASSRIYAYSALTATSVSIDGEVTDEGTSVVTSRGICYSTTFPPTVASTKVNAGSGSGTFEAPVTGLTSGTTYHFRTFAVNGVGTSYGIVLSITTPGGCSATTQYPTSTINGPTANGQTVPITTLTSTTCNYSGEYSVVSLGTGSYTLTSSTSTDYFSVKNSSGTLVSAGFQPLVFNAANQGNYQVHVFKDAICTVENVCRAVSITKNNPPTLPTVTTNPATQITPSSAFATGIVTNAGSGTVNESGFCFSTSANPTISNFKVALSSGTGAYSGNMTGLNPGTLYHFRAYATSTVGTAYGSDLTFTTLPAGAGCIGTSWFPQVTINGPSTNGETVQVTDLSTTNCSYAGEFFIISIPPGSYTALSSTSTDFFTLTSNDNTNTILGKGVQPFTFSIVNGGDYKIHIFKDNLCTTEDVCRAISVRKNFPPTIATVTTIGASSITENTATCSGSVTSQGTSVVTSRGICYSTDPYPTMTGSNVASGSGLGGFSAQLTGLTQSTIYYYRAFAVNAVGVAYGENASFTTVAATIPILSTTSVTNVTSTTATAGGDISSIGGSPVTSKGVCYDTLTNPTLASNLVSGGSGPGPFSCNIFGLQPDKTYYLRAYANNASGTAYGNQVSFTTLVTQNMEIQSIDETYHIYPNPFQHEVFVERTGKEAAIRYQIINSLGMKVMDGILRPGESKLQAGKLSPGLYTIQFAGHAGIKIRKE